MVEPTEASELLTKALLQKYTATPVNPQKHPQMPEFKARVIAPEETPLAHVLQTTQHRPFDTID